MTQSNNMTVAYSSSGISVRDATHLAIMVLLWGISWPAMKTCLYSISPLWMATIRFGSAAICLFIFVYLRGELKFPVRQDFPIIASVGLLQMMAFTALGLMAMMKIGAGQAALLAYTTPLWVALVTVIVLRRPLEKGQLSAVIIGLLGIFVVCSPSLINWQAAVVSGNLMLLGAAVCWAIVIVHVRLHHWHATPLMLAPWQMLLATIPLVIISLMTEGLPEISWSANLLGLLLLTGPVATCLCFVISLAVGRRINSVSMSLATLGVPVIGLISSVIFLDEIVTPAIIVGIALILASLLGVLRKS